MRIVTCPSPEGELLGVEEPPGAEHFREGVTPRTRRVLAVASLPAAPRAVPRLRRLARAVARRRQLSAGAEEALTMIVSELVTNVVLHSGSPDLAVMFEADDASLTVVVRDRGRWRDRPSPRCEPADMDAGFGRGLALVDAYSVDGSVCASAEGTLVRAVIAL
ncbi:ATP-binding protein [Streptomyces sp. NPDC006430]|uniref:ATP-binding protein n=1 Tax=Streptomyces sp. NPDC006430 TaxID=3154299 RepID=UPI0033AE2D17